MRCHTDGWMAPPCSPAILWYASPKATAHCTGPVLASRWYTVAGGVVGTAGSLTWYTSRVVGWCVSTSLYYHWVLKGSAPHWLLLDG